MEYIIIYGDHEEAITDGINSKLKEGWEPLGGISVTSDGDYEGEIVLYFAQAMIRKEVK